MNGFLGFIISILSILGVGFLIFFVRRKDEKKNYQHFKKMTKSAYSSFNTYRAVIVSGISDIYQTNLIQIVCTKNEIVAIKKMITSEIKSLEISDVDMFSLEYKKINKYRLYLVIEHNIDYLITPFKVEIHSKIDDELISNLNNIKEQIGMQ